ncbi:hypothetical protein FOF48_17740 [Corallococcus sp. Z5C101001]|nr:hypothetical protein FOF48_17740 [Corallococcus sp. Z5C101001]
MLGDDEVTHTEYVCAEATAVLLRTVPLAPGAQCPEGGQVTQAGLDLNGDGVLDDTEVTREVPACTRSATVRTRTRTVLSSEVCRSAATILEVGEDVDGNGVLGTSEVQASHHFCLLNDTQRQVQVQVQPEPAGGICGRPGVRVDAFIDLNDNGQRDPDMEELITLPVCQPVRVHEGSYVVRNATDLAALRGVTRVNGDLFVNSETLSEFALPELSVVVGSLRIDTNPLLTRVDLPGLRFATTVALDRNAELTTASMGDPAGMVSVQWDLFVQHNPLLTTLDGLRALAPGGALTVLDNARLETLGFPAIIGLAKALTVEENPRLRTLSLPRLQTTGSVSLIGATALESLAGLSELRTVESLSLIGNGALTRLDGLDSLVSAGAITLDNNARLQTTAGFPQLVRAGSVTISNNALLESAGGMPLLRTVSESFTVLNNPKLRTVSGLDLLDFAHSVSVEQNPMLNDLIGFGNLMRLDRLSVRDNERLETLARLMDLRRLEFLVVTDNVNLKELRLDGLEAVEQGFTMTGNLTLPTCLARDLANRTFSGKPGNVTIAGNGDFPSACTNP